mgnify:CR=1 FL=1
MAFSQKRRAQMPSFQPQMPSRPHASPDPSALTASVSPEASGVAPVEEAVAAADARNYIVDTDSFELLSDQVHYNAAGQIDLGFGFADAIKNTF